MLLRTLGRSVLALTVILAACDDDDDPAGPDPVTPTTFMVTGIGNSNAITA